MKTNRFSSKKSVLVSALPLGMLLFIYPMLDCAGSKTPSPIESSGVYSTPAPPNPNPLPIDTLDPKGRLVPKGAALPASAYRGFTFETVTLNSNGSVTNRRRAEANSYVEDIGGVTLEMVEVRGGKYQMGTSERDLPHVIKEAQKYCSNDKCRNSIAADIKSETPQHSVTVPGFYMGKFEVTQAQWRAVARLPKVNSNLAMDPSPFLGNDFPVDSVSWKNAREFCARLSKATGREYRLPSEAEWEYAARAGTTTQFAFGETVTANIVNYEGESPYGGVPPEIYRGKAVPVGSLGVANGFGLYDMYGNVWEWCDDVGHPNYEGAPTDGSAWISGGDPSHRMLRGASWIHNGWQCRSAYRFNRDANIGWDDFGFRVLAEAKL